MSDPKSTYTDLILFPFLILFTVSLPFPIAFNSIFTGLLFITFLADAKNIRNNTISYFKNKRNILLLALFSTLLFSVIYSEDKQTAIKGVLAALPFLSLPLSLITIQKLSTRQVNLLKKAFVYSCLAASLFYFFQTSVRIGLWDGSYKTVAPSLAYKSSYLVYNLTYHQLTPSIHAVFFSFYLAMAVIVIIFDFEKRSFLSKILFGLLITYFVVYLFLLTSATINFGLYSFLIAQLFFKLPFKKIIHYFQFFGLLIIGTAITDYLLIVKFIGPDIGNIVYKFDDPSINEKVVYSFAGIIIVSALALVIKLTNYRFLKYGLAGLLLIGMVITIFYSKKFLKSNNNELNNLAVRANYGAEAFKIISKNVVWGVGAGDKKMELIIRDTSLGDNRYIEFGANTKPGDIFNPHNQFLDFWISAGIIPVICLILLFIREFVSSYSYRNMSYLALVFIFLLFCFTDRALMIQRGQVFFLFFICLFEMESKRKTKPRQQ